MQFWKWREVFFPSLLEGLQWYWSHDTVSAALPSGLNLQSLSWVQGPWSLHMTHDCLFSPSWPSAGVREDTI